MSGNRYELSYEAKVAKLKEIISEAVKEQKIPTRIEYFPVPDAAFDARINQYYWRQLLGDVLQKTEALEILGDIVFGREVE